MDDTREFSTVERMLLDSAQKNRVSANGSIELLPLCNMNCDMCYVRLSREEMERQGRLRTAEEWLEIGRQMQAAGVLLLLLTGGEPLLYPGFKELYLGLKQLGFILSINTNGTLIDEDWADFFAAHKPRQMNITLYGVSDDTYASLCHYPGGYTKTIRAIRLLRERGIEVRMSATIGKTNRQDLPAILKLGDELNITVQCDTYLMPGERERTLPFDRQARLSPEQAAAARVEFLRWRAGDDLFRQYVQQSVQRARQAPEGPAEPGRMTCMAGSCSFTINWQGEMRPCVILSEPAVSVFEVGFEAAWKYIVEETDKILLNAKCSTCHMRHLCRTCAASALLETGSYDGVPDYMCRYAEESLRLLREEWEKIQDGQDISDR